ncbi:MAG: hypothetical protein HQM15_06065 [Deltaproteobacteria bacterium]|nr:hypothetical protein [Deltaproteobacteria bacterium]
MLNSFFTTHEDLQDSEILLLFAKQVRRGLGKLEPLHQYLLEQSSLPQDQIEFQKMKELSDSLLATTHSLMDFLEKDNPANEEIPFSLRTSLGKIIQLYSHLFSENQGSFEFLIPPLIPDTLLGSPAQLKRIVSLFFAQGLVCKGPVYGTLQEEQTQKESLHFILEIPGKEMDLKLDTLRLENFLYQKLVKKMGGRNWIESGPNTFKLHLELPVKIHPLVEEPEQRRFSLAGKKVLVIDSPSGSLQTLSQLIESWKLEVLYTPLPEEARKVLSRSTQEGPPLDFVIVEKELLGQSAFEWLLEKSTERKNIPFILITSSPERGDAALCIQHGIQAYLTQPLHGIELWEVLQHLLNQGKTASSPLLTRHVLLERDRHFKILVWDPREKNREKFMQLKKQGHALHELKDSNELPSKLKQTAYDLILIDFESLEEGFRISDLRSIARNQRTPIIGLSRKGALPKDEGFDALLSSPIRDEDLFNLLGQSS